MPFQPTPDFRHDRVGRIGILLTNLGTPDAPTPGAVRRYLAEFLADPRVVEFPRLPWWLILHGIILRFRPRKAAHAYARIWETEGSPLLNISRRQCTALQDAMDARYPGGVKVSLGMRYGKPSLAAAMDELRAAGAERVLVLPLYPQYSASTTASTVDAVNAYLGTWRWIPELRFVTHYHDDPGYIDALAASIQAHFETHGKPERLLFSFHGIPRRYFMAGDPYHCHCQKTARLVAEQLRLDADDWMLTFQSRFGREKWLEPYTDVTLKAIARQGVRHVAVACPGFSADCLETLEEIDMLNRDIFLGHGGERFHYIPALNDGQAHIAALAELAARHLSGWPEVDPAWSATRAREAARESLERAREMGARR